MWKLVPVEPTPEMEPINGSANWGRMLSASPDPTTDEALVERVKDAIGYQMAAVVSRNNQPHMSGDPRNRIPPALRRIFDESVRDAALAAIRAMEKKP